MHGNDDDGSHSDWLEGSDAGQQSGRVQGALDAAKALALLSPVARSVVWLHDVEGYTHGEIGELMGKTTSFSKSQLSRAHQRLRELMDTDSGNGECTRQQNSY